jgi:hypothetical protein
MDAAPRRLLRAPRFRMDRFAAEIVVLLNCPAFRAAQEIRMTNAHTHTPPSGELAEKKTEVQAKQGTDAPRGMPVVLIVSTVGAAVAMWIAWTVFFAPG